MWIEKVAIATADHAFPRLPSNPWHFNLTLFLMMWLINLIG